MNSEKEYELIIDLNVLNHLGLKLYSNVPAVLSELIANAWDADANTLSVSVEAEPDSDSKKIIVTDDGHGMDDADLREKFLTVGYQRRDRGEKDTTPKGRKVMGRKGIGKLSVFSIAGKVHVHTKKKDSGPLSIELDVTEIKNAIEAKQNYNPVPIEADLSLFPKGSGTVLILSDLKKRVNASLDTNLKRRIARRFSVISQDFKVFINGEEVTLDDMIYFSKLEYALVYGDDYDQSRFTHEREYVKQRDNSITYDQEKYFVRGWIGLAKNSGLLDDGSDNLNKISILTRGKLALEDILSNFREGGMYTKYVIGEMEADFLDSTNKEDIATSSRQDFIRTDPRFDRLATFIKKELNFLESERKKLKEKTGTTVAFENPAIKEWYEELGTDSKKIAKNLFGRINNIDTCPSQRKTLYKHGILAFEHLRYKKKLSDLEKLDIANLEAAVSLFSELDDIEATWYYEITKGRLDIIKKLCEDTEKNALEKVLQEHIYSHLWLLDPSWDRATETPNMEQTVAKGFSKVSEKLTSEEKRARIDIKYKKVSGKHIIIELKRASVKVSDISLMSQADKYSGALEKQLQSAKETGPIEIVCVVGRELDKWDNKGYREKSEKALEAKGIKVITYQQLIKDAQMSYQNYLDKESDKGRIRDILDSIDQSSEAIVSNNSNHSSHD